MKKVIALVLILTAVSFGTVGAIAVQVDSNKDRVTVTENALYGDSSLAHGLNVKIQAHYDDRLYWYTDYHIGETPTVSTKYDFSLSEQHEKGKNIYGGISLSVSYSDWSMDTTTPIEELTGFAKVYRELYDATPIGTESKKTVYIKDYYDYYPLSVRIELPNTVWTGDEPSVVEGTKAGDEIYEYANFREFFKIPVEDTETFEMTVDRDNSNGIHTQGVISAHYMLYTLSTYTDNGICYFSVYNRTADGGFVDTSLIPGGYGLYAFNFGRAKGVYDSGVYADSLQTVYALEEDVIVTDLATSEDQTKLLLFTKEDNAKNTYLTVIDIATMTAIQKIVLFEGGFSHIWVYDDFIAFDLGDEIAWIAVNTQGEYEWKAVHSTPDWIDSDFQTIYSSAVMDFDGERLVVIDRLRGPIYGTLETCSFYVAIYDTNGLAYYGEYENSLSVNPRNYMYAFNCLPSGANPFRAEWISRTVPGDPD